MNKFNGQKQELRYGKMAGGYQERGEMPDVKLEV